MEKKSLLIFLFCVFTFTIQAQNNLQQGYIIQDQNDTVFGEIDNKSYFLNAQYCDFKADGSDNLVRYYPPDLFGYRSSIGKYYISKEVKINGKDSIVFLEYIMHGKIDFYFMQDNGRINHYYGCDSTSPIVELLFNEEIIHKNGKMYLRENKQYISVLEYLTRDYPEMKKEIEYLPEPTHRNLIKIGEDYHKYICKDWDCVIYHKKMKYKYVVELAAGYKLFSKNFDNDFRSQSDPLVGFKFYINNPRFSEWSFLGTGFIYEGVSIVDSSGVKYQNYKIPLTYNYSSPKKGLSLNAGAGINFRNYQDQFYTSVSAIPGLKYNTLYFEYNLYIEFEFGSIFIIPRGYHSTNFGLGIRYKIN